VLPHQDEKQSGTNTLAQSNAAQYIDTQMEERELVCRMAKGDEHAYAQLVTRYSPPTYRFLYRMLGSMEDAEDVTQDTFFELHKNREKLRTDVDILPYLFTIARRKAITLLRWKTVRRKLSPLGEEHENTVASSAILPRDQFHDRKVEELVNQAIGKLKPAKRAVVILRFFEGLSYQDIAHVMNKPEGTVKSLAFRAEKELRRRLAAIEQLW
jgi:RNA polymerase sigma-70 factor (ECF subfamily)